ncbi:MAG: PAS domain-containing protein, partial [Alphaproteobacteria bacterium]|nr:PAS domain-containing protein [Alphaproteobacteria bacterium]
MTRTARETIRNADPLAHRKRPRDEAPKALATAAFEAAFEPIFVVGQDGLIIRVNAAAVRLCGHPAADMAGMAMGVLVDKWPDDSAASNIGRFAGGRRRANLRQADGHAVPIEMAFTQTSSDGRPLTVISLHEITGQHLQEQDARSRDTRLDDFSEAAASWFWESDAELRFTYISANFQTITGRDPNRYIGALQTDLIRGMAEQDVFERHIEDLRNHRPFRNFECDYRHANGEIRRAHVNGQPVLDTDGTFLGYRGT